MPATGNFFFIRSTKLKSSEALSIEGKRLWDSSGTIFSRINALCGDGTSRLFAEPTVKNQDEGHLLNVAWFGSYDDDAKDLAAIDRAKLARVEDDLVQRLDALRPALADPEVGPIVAAMLNVYDFNSVVAVGENAVITNWGALPHETTASQAAYAKHVDATIGRYLKSDLSPRLPGRAWTAHGGMEPMGRAPQLRPQRAAASSVAPSAAAASTDPAAATATAKWWVPAMLVLFFGAILAYVGWPGNLIYEKEAPVDEGVLALLDASNQRVSQNISALREELNKDACAIDPTLVGLPARDTATAPAMDRQHTANPEGKAQEGAAGKGDAK